MSGPPASLGKRLLWLLAIWSASVAALGAVAMAIRLVIKHGTRGG